MNPTASSKNRTVALPKLNKGYTPGNVPVKIGAAADDGLWNSVALPYLLPLARRAA
jgi:hypothetical protein